MSRRSNRGAAGGFTLVEILVVVASLGMILWMVGSLFFPMRQAAERQRLQVEARQAARGAVDYVSYILRGATDLNYAATPRNPAAVLTYAWRGDPDPAVAPTNPTCPGDGACVQLSFNDVAAGSKLGTEGTDIITVATQQDSRRIAGGRAWPVPYDNASFQYWVFTDGCSLANPDVANLNAFKQLTEDPADNTRSRLLIVMNQDPTNGMPWFFYRITDYLATDGFNTSTCSNPQCVIGGFAAPQPCFKVQAQPSDAAALNPPGGVRLSPGFNALVAGTQFTTLRVCRGWLEQKTGSPFDPAADANCDALPAGAEFPAWEAKAGWSPLLPNVEDLQIAYLYLNGEVWNSPARTLSGTEGCTDGVPLATSDAATNVYDVSNVVGFRITVTARSSVAVVGGGKQPQPPPSAEDHDTTAAPADTYFRYQVSSTVLLRNRAAGS